MARLSETKSQKVVSLIVADIENAQVEEQQRDFDDFWAERSPSFRNEKPTKCFLLSYQVVPNVHSEEH